NRLRADATIPTSVATGNLRDRALCSLGLPISPPSWREDPWAPPRFLIRLATRTCQRERSQLTPRQVQGDMTMKFKIALVALILLGLQGCGVHTVDTGYRGIKVTFGQVEGDPLSE